MSAIFAVGNGREGAHTRRGIETQRHGDIVQPGPDSTLLAKLMVGGGSAAALGGLIGALVLTERGSASRMPGVFGGMAAVGLAAVLGGMLLPKQS